MRSGYRAWTAEDEAQLAELWGYFSIDTIAKRLDRTVNAVKVRVNRLGLPPFLLSGDYVTLNLLMNCMTGTNVKSYQLKSWVENRGLPVHTQRRSKGYSVRVVYLEEFWEWAEKNRSFIDFSKLEPLALGKEPEWVPEQRRKDYAAFRLQRKDPWTPLEDQQLMHLLSEQKYGYAELSAMLRRSAGAIQRRCRDLNLKDRPVRVATVGPDSVWTDEMLVILADGIRNGDSYTIIGNKIGKSEKAVRGKVYNTYFTEVADKVMAMLGDGAWGDNRPVPSVKTARYLAEYRCTLQRQLSEIAGILRYRMNKLGYEPYWQRFMCLHWNDNHGCLKNCKDCDDCIHFQRIPPQFCKRCGCTFYERSENKFCSACRQARKKQGYRKYMREIKSMKKVNNCRSE